MGKMKIDLSFYSGKKVFVTGHTGFKGTWLCHILANAGAIVTGYSLQAPTDPSICKITGIENRIYHSEISDIRDLEKMRKAFYSAEPEIVFHLAAQPIVVEGYRDPVTTYETNVMGTVNILECVRSSSNVRSFVNITTDKVYQNNEWEWGYRENEPLDGYDPYSNSKSCSELVTHCYSNSFFQKTAIGVSTARAGNVIGGGDYANDRIIPDCVRAAIRGEKMIIRNPSSTRPYQHVLEPLFAYLLIAKEQYDNKKVEGWYNVGPEDVDCVSTLELVQLFSSSWGNGFTYDIQSVNGPHEARNLKLDCSKIKTILAWRPRWHISTAVQKVCEWTRVWMINGDINKVMDEQIMEYCVGWK